MEDKALRIVSRMVWLAAAASATEMINPKKA